ncbi:MAG: cytochrome c [Actinomycetes bacterium]
MTEVPEHLLARSRARRAAMGGGSGDSSPSESSDAGSSSAAVVPAASSASVAGASSASPALVDNTPAVPDPVAPWVAAAQTRQKIPFWAIPVLALLPIWAAVYMLTLDKPTPTELGPYEAGAEVYGNKGCSGCHGTAGAGNGNNPALIGPTGATKVYTVPANQVTWIALGSAGYKAAGFQTYGDADVVRPIGGGMPAWLESLTAEQIMDAVLHERSQLNDEKFDIAKWRDGFEEALSALLPPDKVTQFTAVLDKWEKDPPAPAA